MANILVVDDEHGIRDLLSEILNDEGHAVDLAENAARSGTQELRSLRSGSPTIDSTRARQAALTYLSSHGASGEVDVQNNSIVVTIRASIGFVLLNVIGLRETSITVTRSAEPVTA